LPPLGGAAALLFGADSLPNGNKSTHYKSVQSSDVVVILRIASRLTPTGLGCARILRWAENSKCNPPRRPLLIALSLTDPAPPMKFDLAYCLSLDEKLSIYDVRDLNFDETMAFDSAKEQLPRHSKMFVC